MKPAGLVFVIVGDQSPVVADRIHASLRRGRWPSPADLNPFLPWNRPEAKRPGSKRAPPPRDLNGS